MPIADGTENVLKFKNFSNKFKHPIVIYADFETLLVPETESSRIHHKESSVAYCVVTSTGESKFKLFRSENCLQEFFTAIKSEAKTFFTSEWNKFPKPKLSKEEEDKFNLATNCCICDGLFSNEEVMKDGKKYKLKSKVRHHDHYTGENYGAAHLDCNARDGGCHRRLSIPILFHNLSRYDGHIIVRALESMGDVKNIRIIPKTEEEYMSIQISVNIGNNRIIDLKFLDSYRFLSTSLDELSSNLLSEGRSKFKYLTKHVRKELYDSLFWDEETEIAETIACEQVSDTPKGYKNITKVVKKPRIKGIYPYQFTDSFEKFNYNKVLTKDEFYDSLNKKSISDQEYEQYIKVWNNLLKLNPNSNLGTYSDLYLITDVLALADVFEEFRSTSLQYYELDPVYYVTTPSLAFDAMLKKTNVKLELLTDYDMVLMVESGIRGGISGVCGDRYVNVTDKPNEHLLYLDANNLYGYAMSQSLPTHGFKWGDQSTITELDKLIRSNKVSDLLDKGVGCVLEVDLTVPKTKKFENYPLAPETKIIKEHQLTDYMKTLLENSGEKFQESKKLILDFTDKKNYVVDLRNLDLYYKLGCEFKINRAILYHQSPFLKTYIDFNTKMRAKSKK